jgi:hypothetical protein
VYGLNDPIAPEDVQYGSAAVAIEAGAAVAAEPAPVATVEQASETAAVSLPATGFKGASFGGIDAALEQLILQTLAPAASEPASAEAPAAPQDQVVATPSAPGLANLLAGVSSASGAVEETTSDSGESDEESEEDSAEVDATSLNLL